MIKCPNCQTENRMSSIFCRGCGTKLAIEDVNVQNFEQMTGIVPASKKKSRRKKIKLVLNIIELILILAVAYGVFLAIQKPALPEIKTTSTDLTSFLTWQDNLLKADENNKSIKKTFTEEEINSYALDLSPKDEKNSRTKLKGIIVDFKEDNRVSMYFLASALGQQITLNVSGKLSADDGGLTFEPNGFFAARIGKLPFPMALFQRITKNLLTENDKLVKFLDSITDIKTTDTKVTVLIGEGSLD